MGLGDRLHKAKEELVEPHADGISGLKVGDPAYDDWSVLRDFSDLETARAFRQQLEEAGLKAVLTADQEPDGFGHGDIALRVPQEDYAEASNFLEPEL